MRGRRSTEARASGGRPAAISDRWGKFTLEKSLGDYTEFTVDHPDYLLECRRCENLLGIRKIDTRLEDAVTLTGTVRRGGRPLQGWHVSVGSVREPYGGVTLSSITDGQGHYVIPRVKAWKTRAFASPSADDESERFLHREADLSLAVGEAVIDFELPTIGATIEGIIRLQDEYLGGVCVFVNVDGPFGECHYMRELPSPGAFRLEDLLPGSATLYGSVRSGDYFAKRSVTVQLREGEKVDLVLDLGPLVFSPMPMPRGALESGSR